MAWDKTKPTGATAVKDSDDAIRANWAYIETALDAEHDFTEGGADGVHKEGSARITVDTQTNRPTAAKQGRLFAASDKGYRIQVDTGSGWQDAIIPSGTKMLFLQSSAPTGWTQDNTWNDRVIRVVDNTGTGTTTGGSWTVSGLTDSGHTHGVGSYATSGDAANAGGFNPVGATNVPTLAHTHTVTGTSASGTATIASDATWRPSYVDAIVCSKD